MTNTERPKIEYPRAMTQLSLNYNTDMTQTATPELKLLDIFNIEWLGNIEKFVLLKRHNGIVAKLKQQLAEKNRKIDECPKGGKYYKKDFDASKVDLCPHCNCMTHTIGRAECGKCHQDKRILIMSKEKE